jgi:hypothetical protein
MNASISFVIYQSPSLADNDRSFYDETNHFMDRTRAVSTYDDDSHSSELTSDASYYNSRRFSSKLVSKRFVCVSRLDVDEDLSTQLAQYGMTVDSIPY